MIYQSRELKIKSENGKIYGYIHKLWYNYYGCNHKKGR